MTTPAVDSASLREITEQIWESYLDPLGISPLLPSTAAHAHGPMAAAVSVSGAWTGHVVVQCSAAASRDVAAALLSLEPTTVTDADITDALGELANVIGGNVKALLPDNCRLSLPYPVPTEGPGRPGGTEVCRLDSSWLDEPVTIVVLES